MKRKATLGAQHVLESTVRPIFKVYKGISKVQFYCKFLRSNYYNWLSSNKVEDANKINLKVYRLKKNFKLDNLSW